MLYSAERDEGFCWRPWPCSRCCEDVTPIGFLLGSDKAGPAIQHLPESPEKVAAQQVAALRDWVNGCPHAGWQSENLPLIAEGSEHLVFLDEQMGEVDIRQTSAQNKSHHEMSSRVKERLRKAAAR